MKNVLTVLLLSLVVVSNSYAADPYIFASIGKADFMSKMSIDGFGEFDWDKVKDEDTYTSIGFGFSVNKSISLELGFNQFGGVKGDAYETVCTVALCNFNGPYRYMLETEVASVSVAAKVLFPVGSNFFVFGRVGFESWEGDYEFSGEATFNGVVVPDFSTEGSDDGTSAFYGIGISCDVTKRFSVAAQYEIHKFESSDVIDNIDGFDVDIDVNALSVFAAVSF